MKTPAKDLKIDDVIRKPLNLRGARIASLTTIEGQIVCYVTGHPDTEVRKFHSPPDFIFDVNRPKTTEDVLYEITTEETP